MTPLPADYHPYKQFDQGRLSEDLQYVDLEEKKSIDSEGLRPGGFDPPLRGTNGVEEQAFTFRAVFVGTILGAIIGASNMYLGLTVGWTFGASLFGSIVGFAILKPLSRILSPRFGGGYFGPKENCTVQSSATAAGGLSVGFVTAIPALYRLGLMSDTVAKDVVPLLLFALAAAYYGLFFAIPLRRYFILKQKLIFPSATVSAETIKSLHDSVEGELNSGKKAKILVTSFVLAFAVKCITWWIPVLLEWHPLYFIGKAARSIPLMAADALWRWRLEFRLAFLGAGMLVGMNTATSFFAGSVTAWAIIGPTLLATGTVTNAFGFPHYTEFNSTTSIEEFNRQVTAQYWLLWPGVVLMIASSFAELGVRWKSLARGFTGLFQETKGGIKAAAKITRKGSTGSSYPMTRVNSEEVAPAKVSTDEKREQVFGEGMVHADPADEHSEEEDPTLPHERVPALWWGTGLLVSTVFTTAILTWQFGLAVYEGLIAIILGFLLAFVGLQAAGETDINPTGAIGKTTQFIFAAFRHSDMRQALKTNLIAGNVAAACASQTVDMVEDLKTAHLLRSPPRAQFLAQALASLAAVFLSVGLFILFGTSYPCILRMPVPGQTCEFEAPAVASWTAVSVALTSGIDKTVPASAAWMSLAMLIICIVFTIVKYNLVRPNFRQFLPSLSAFGIALVNPQPYIGLAMFTGALITFFWKRRSPTSHELYCYAVASGLVAGEGVGGIVEALYALAGLDRTQRAVQWGIPVTNAVRFENGSFVVA
ncbi:OPT superfamily oligopeptide transporter [Spizellomyces punctatus DAOM BR117]|uniref:OPT superfamily oligopeptide transporter n=1 Tax=Spizellomyces punctatus (strain DAOM BR117) TaxID=645134 RepID=A0A0L0HIU7_SPIPD|nr:OPT superfamily oligopeptide transporter [Spizellomyces punctatus DAOM BR117]KND00958.1 OPT superfamily oligopeptide transporter [Spizellomyces punctatus DAOM BR117]|eukprot:XP_016608997.1 OPT superfamily oligopeptide transporter [Spizellomyces punctatus DAOM BR117]